MSNMHLLQFLVQKGDRALPWELDLTGRNVVLLRARTLAEAVSLTRAYPMMMVIFDLMAWDEHAREAVQQVEAVAAAGHRPALLGLLRFEPDRDQRRELTAAGLDGVICQDDPERFLLWPIGLLTHLSELSRFEQSRIDVGQLAHRTRQKLHDLSQPLSAVQGRLQLLAAKAGRDDPNAQYLQELVRLILEVSNQVMEIQRIHRDFS